MLLGNRKKQTEERNWCVVLHRLQNEIDKKKVASKISEVFGLSLDEAFDLASNTPIILLDNLNEEIAAQIKDYFSVLGAEMKMTNDVFVKRKCYRTVWPEAPNLSFLHKLEEESSFDEKIDFKQIIEDENENEQSDAQLLQDLEKWQKECGERSEEVNSLKKELERHESLKKKEFVANNEDDRKFREIDAENKELRRKTLEQAEMLKSAQSEKDEITKVWQDKYEELKRNFEKRNEEYRASASEAEKVFENFHSLQNKKRSLEEELLALRDNLGQGADEMALRTKQLEQELVLKHRENLQLVKEAENEKRKNLDLIQRLEKAQLVKNELSEQIHDQQLTSQQEISKLQKKLDVVIETLEAQKEKNEQSRIDFQNQKEMLSSKQSEIEKYQEELNKKDGMVNKIQGEFKRANENLLSSQDAIRVMEERLKSFELENQKLLKDLNQMRQLESLWKEKHDSVMRKLDAHVAKQLENEQKIKAIETTKSQLQSHLSLAENQNSQFETKVLALEKQTQELSIENSAKLQMIKEQAEYLEQNKFELEQMTQQLEFVKQEMDKQSLKAAEEFKEKESDFLKLKQVLLQKDEVLEKTLERCRQFEAVSLDLRGKLDASVTMLKEKDQFVESKSIEIEAVKKQLKGLSAQFDQREVMLKRTHLSERIKLKESELKDLVSEQTAIESEIRQREEKMRAVLAKQEKIEKEIVGAKQSQRHLNEQANKDDSGFDKLKKTESPSNGNTPNA
jgi:hypothetical protein